MKPVCRPESENSRSVGPPIWKHCLRRVYSGPGETLEVVLTQRRSRAVVIFTESSAKTNRCHTPSKYTLTRICYVEYIKRDGICLRNHCGAEPPRDTEPPGLVTTVGGRNRASTSYVAADCVKAPASAARRRFRGIHGGRTAPSLPAET